LPYRAERWWYVDAVVTVTPQCLIVLNPVTVVATLPIALIQPICD